MKRLSAGLFAVVILCTGIFALAQSAVGQTLTPEERAKLEAEYSQIQKEIEQWQKVLEETKAKKNSLSGDVTALTAQINKAQAEIKQRTVVITKLQGQITEKAKNVQTLENRLSAGRQSLAKLLREKNEKESQSLAVLALGSGTLSNFFLAVNDINTINEKLQTHFDDLQNVKSKTQKEKDALAQQQNAQLDARHEVQQKERQISTNKAEKDKLLKITKEEEKAYAQVLAERRKRAEQIRAALFELRDADGIPFATALSYANQAESATGVRAAFILGILRQESNLGKNVGQCLLVDPKTGTGKGKNTGKVIEKVMKPDRDVQPFLAIVESLGRDPYSMPVSCPQSIGWGGAMGPSQFIASTWRGYETRLKSALGVPAADPWVARHAIMATALYLKDLGAGKQTYSAEREAAARYYAGGGWQQYGLGYASSVLSFAEKYQNDIDFLKEQN